MILLIHHVWPGTDPFRYPEYRQSWLRHHPDATMRFWRDAHGLDERVQQLVADPRYSPVVKSDVLRWAVLLAHGGIYVDTDMECLGSIREYLSDPNGCFLAKEDDTYACTAIIAAEPGHEFVRQVLDAALAALATTEPNRANAEPQMITGPHLVTRLAKNARVTLHGYERFYPTHWGGRTTAPLAQAVTVHHWKAAWKEPNPPWELVREVHVVSSGKNPPPALRARHMASIAKQIGVKVVHHVVDAATQSPPRGKVDNLHAIVSRLPREAIVAEVDLDDELAHPEVLRKISKLYDDPDVWLTYGSFAFSSDPQRLVDMGVYRDPSRCRGEDWRASHLKTYRAALFHSIPLAELKNGEEWADGNACDQVTMLPMLERAGAKHVRHVPEVLYLYHREASHEQNSALLHQGQAEAQRIRTRTTLTPLAELLPVARLASVVPTPTVSVLMLPTTVAPPVQATLVHSAQATSVPTSGQNFRIAIAHASFRPDRVKSLEQMLGQLEDADPIVFSSHQPESNMVWAKRIWTWAAQQDCPVLVLNDDLLLPPDFLRIVQTLIAAAPGRILSLHPQGSEMRELAARGERWAQVRRLTGPAYVIPNANMAAEWLTFWGPNTNGQNEDGAVEAWMLHTRTLACACIPAVVQHRIDIPSTYPGYDTHPDRQTSVPWEHFPHMNLFAWPAAPAPLETYRLPPPRVEPASHRQVSATRTRIDPSIPSVRNPIDPRTMPKRSGGGGAVRQRVFGGIHRKQH